VRAGEAIVWGIPDQASYPWSYDGKGSRRDKWLNEEKAKIVLDLANKKRNTAACFEVGYVSSSLPIGAEFSDSTPPRFTNYSRTLS
jgi:hypothetical protein